MKASSFDGFRSIYHGVWSFVFYFLVLLIWPEIVSSQTGPSRDTPDGSSFGPIVSRKTATSFIVVVSIFFVVGLFAVYARHCIGNRRRGGFSVDLETAGGQTTGAGRGLDKAVIDSFPTFAYSSVKEFKIGKSSLECAVCLNEFSDEEKLRLLPKCSHVFHSDCVDAWLISHSTCPLCRDNLVPANGAGAGDRSLPNESENGEAIENTNPNQPISGLTPIPHRRITGIFLRSHTTGHSLVQPLENNERFTLRLPEGVRSQLLNSTASLNRARSCASLAGIPSSRHGPRLGGGTGKNSIFPTNQIERWRFLPENGSGTIQNSEFEVNDDAGERSFSRLRPAGNLRS